MARLMTRTAITAALILGLALPACAGARVPSAFVGIYAENSDVPADEVSYAMAHQRQVGAGLVREPFYWDRIERSPGNFDWAATDSLVETATAHHLRLLPILWSPPTFRSSRPDGEAPKGMYPPSDPAAFARFAEALVRRYGPGGSFWCTQEPTVGGPGETRCREPYRPMRAWQIWNEEDYDHFWPAGPDAQAYLAMLRPVSDAIHAVDPKAEVVLGGLSIRALTRHGFLDQLYAAGGRSAFDTLAMHPYAATVRGMLRLIHRARAIAKRHGVQAPIRVTEYGWATGGHSKVGHIVSESCQAALVNQATRELIRQRERLGLRGIVQFMWNDRNGRSTLWPFHAGLFRTDGSGKPSAHAFAKAVKGQPLPASHRAGSVCPARNR